MRHLKKQVKFKEKYLYESCKFDWKFEKSVERLSNRETSWAIYLICKSDPRLKVRQGRAKMKRK